MWATFYPYPAELRFGTLSLTASRPPTVVRCPQYRIPSSDRDPLPAPPRLYPILITLDASCLGAVSSSNGTRTP